MTSITQIREAAAKLNTTIGMLNTVSYKLFDVAVHELSESEFTEVTTDFMTHRHEYEPEQMF